MYRFMSKQFIALFAGLQYVAQFPATLVFFFTVVYSVTWPLNGSEARGDLALIQTSLLLLCKLE